MSVSTESGHWVRDIHASLNGVEGLEFQLQNESLTRWSLWIFEAQIVAGVLVDLTRVVRLYDEILAFPASSQFGDGVHGIDVRAMHGQEHASLLAATLLEKAECVCILKEVALRAAAANSGVVR